MVSVGESCWLDIMAVKVLTRIGVSGSYTQSHPHTHTHTHSFGLSVSAEGLQMCIRCFSSQASRPTCCPPKKPEKVHQVLD